MSTKLQVLCRQCNAPSQLYCVSSKLNKNEIYSYPWICRDCRLRLIEEKKAKTQKDQEENE